MSMDLNNDMQDAGVITPVTTEKPHAQPSEFFTVVDQKAEKNEKVFNYQTNANVKTDVAYSLEQIRSLSTPELSSMLIKSQDGKTSDELIQEEYNRDSTDGRENAILIEAMRFGAQSALYNRMLKYQSIFNKSKHELNRVFNFAPLLMLGGRVIPPVISESDDMTMIPDQYTRRTVDKSYKIISQARVINTPLDWRTYLLVTPPKPSLPAKYALPIKGNEREEKIWENGVSQGWEAGLKQANDITLQNINKIERDYVGMIRYHLMATKNIVSSPIPSNVNLGITSNSDSLNIGEVIFEIAELPKFNKDVDSWVSLPQIKAPIDFNRLKNEK